MKMNILISLIIFNIITVTYFVIRNSELKQILTEQETKLNQLSSKTDEIYQEFDTFDFVISRKDNRLDILEYAEKFDMIYLTMLQCLIDLNSTTADKKKAIEDCHIKFKEQLNLARLEIERNK